MKRLQYPLIQDYALKILRRSLIRFKVSSLIEGYWSLWELDAFLGQRLLVEGLALRGFLRYSDRQKTSVGLMCSGQLGLGP